MANDFKDKKVLVFGLGLLGGGVATTNWLIKQGARVTVTDPLDAKRLAVSLRRIKGKVRLSLGGQNEKDFREADIVAVNPAFPPTNKYVKLAMKLDKTVTNETIIFYNNWPKSLIGVTGTRGKTTTTHWINHFLKGTLQPTIVGNSQEFPFLKILDKSKQFDIAVAETPSFQLEYFNSDVRPPEIAVITNIYSDHLNFHGNQKAYAGAKANIFRNQIFGQCLILNADNQETKFLLRQKPKSHVWFFSKKALTKERNGLFYRDEAAFYQFEGRSHVVLNLKGFGKEHGEHNLENLLAAALAAFLAGVSGRVIQKRIKTLPEIEYRQQTVFENKKLTIINDTTATSPEGGIAAMKRFGGKDTILITGGTDRDLDYKMWAKELPKYIRPENVVFLNGSATKKMLKKLKSSFAKATKDGKILIFDSLGACFLEAIKKSRNFAKSVILFSPSAKSFEKFKNEYDRGEQFNKLVKNL